MPPVPRILRNRPEQFHPPDKWEMEDAPKKSPRSPWGGEDQSEPRFVVPPPELARSFSPVLDREGQNLKPSLLAYSQGLPTPDSSDQQKRRKKRGRAKQRHKADFQSSLDPSEEAVGQDSMRGQGHLPDSTYAQVDQVLAPHRWCVGAPVEDVMRLQKEQAQLYDWRVRVATSALRFARTADVPAGALQHFGAFTLD